MKQHKEVMTRQQQQQVLLLFLVSLYPQHCPFTKSWSLNEISVRRKPLILWSRRRRGDNFDDKNNNYYNSFDYWQQQQEKEEPNDYYPNEVNDSYQVEDDDDDDYNPYRSNKVDNNEKYQPPLQENYNDLEWEACSCDTGTAHVLLPVDRPTCVIFFVGGTFFGSAPSWWYHGFLTDLVKHTQAAVIATSIPVTLSTPLNHVSLAKKLQRQFQVAWRDVLVDEYGQQMEGIPICGIGHSLGARLLVVLATLHSPPQQPSKESQRPSWPSSYPKPPTTFKALVLISFTNHGAATAIPGIHSLNRASRKLEQEINQAKKKNAKKNKSRNRQTSSQQSWYYDPDSNYYENDEYEEEEEEDWGDILEDLGTIVQEQATKLKSVLTPSSESLEFYPGPDQLWKALALDHRYTVNNTLVVQFDDDEMDQSSKLAFILQNVNRSVFFSRIRGTHLTPILLVSSSSSSSPDNGGLVNRIYQRLGKELARIWTGRPWNNLQNKEARSRLRQAVSSYLIEILAKPDSTPC